MSLSGLRATKDHLIVDPYYDPDQVSSGLTPGAPALWLPDSAKNPLSQQGRVVCIGPEQRDIKVDDHVLYHPFVGTPFKLGGYEYLRLEARHVVGWLDDDGVLYPLPDDVVLLPRFKTAGRPVLEGHVWVPKSYYAPEPPCVGKIAAVGERVTSVQVGQHVLFPLRVGNEVGLTRVYYTIHAEDLLAVVTADTDVSIQVTPANWGNGGNRNLRHSSHSRS